MPNTQTDLVVRISTSKLDSETAERARGTTTSCLIAELHRCLRPGAEIALVLEGYIAITSILWLSDLQPDGSLHAGIRLVGLSGMPNESQHATRGWKDLSHGANTETLDLAATCPHL